MNRQSIVVALATCFIALSSAAQDTTNPIRYTWIVTSCERWNCAAAALVMAEGDPHVIALPTGREDRPWLVLRRVEEGSIFIPEEEPFTCDVFSSFTDASAAFGSMEACHAPLIMNVPDGRAVIASLAKCDDAQTKRRRAVH
jgi:hypothetical protein